MKPSAESSDGLIRFLRSTALFADLKEKTLAGLAQASQRKRIPKGNYLFMQADLSDTVYVVRSGSIAIILISTDGRELLINEMRPGDCFGEVGVLTGQPRSTGAVARLNSEVLAIPSAAFIAAIDSEPNLARRVLNAIAERLRASSERESALVFLDAQARLGRVLLQLDQQYSEDGYVTVSQAELAQRTGMTRQTVAKALGKWRRAGWLITGRGRIVVLDHRKLEQLGQQRG
jgi:CRP/FNR family transcriptional regulator, cyclic AMP receptor protein